MPDALQDLYQLGQSGWQALEVCKKVLKLESKKRRSTSPSSGETAAAAETGPSHGPTKKAATGGSKSSEADTATAYDAEDDTQVCPAARAYAPARVAADSKDLRLTVGFQLVIIRP